jgi:magnesium chelatase subunit I
VIEEQVNQQQFEQLDLLPEIEIVKDDPFNSHKSDLDLMGNEVKLAIQKVKYLKQNLSKSQW